LINQLDATAPEGNKTIQVSSTGWGGFGLFFYDTPLNLARYNYLQYYVKSSATVKIQLQDMTGNNYPYYQPAYQSWVKLRLPLKSFVGVDLTRINGFMATMETQGNFAIDYIQFVM